jgi:hypothetical protein
MDGVTIYPTAAEAETAEPRWACERVELTTEEVEALSHGQAVAIAVQGEYTVVITHEREA